MNAMAVLVSGCLAVLGRFESRRTAWQEGSEDTYWHATVFDRTQSNPAGRHRLARGFQLALGVLVGLSVLLSDGVSAQPPQGPAVVGDEYLEWRSGQFSIVAQFVAIEGDSVILQRQDNGQRIAVPLKVLDPASQQQARDCQQASLSRMVDSGTEPAEPESIPARTDASDLQDGALPEGMAVPTLEMQPRPLRVLSTDKVDPPPRVGESFNWRAVIRNDQPGNERRTVEVQWLVNREPQGEPQQFYFRPGDVREHKGEGVVPRGGIDSISLNIREVPENGDQGEGPVSQVTLPVRGVAHFAIGITDNMAKLVKQQTGLDAEEWVQTQIKELNEIFERSGCAVRFHISNFVIGPERLVEREIRQLDRVGAPYVLLQPRHLTPGTRGNEQDSSPGKGWGDESYQASSQASEALAFEFQRLVGLYYDDPIPVMSFSYGFEGNVPPLRGTFKPSPPVLHRGPLELLTEREVEWMNRRISATGVLIGGQTGAFRFRDEFAGIDIRVVYPNGQPVPDARWGVYRAHQPNEPGFGGDKYREVTQGSAHIQALSNMEYHGIQVRHTGRRISGGVHVTSCGVERPHNTAVLPDAGHRKPGWFFPVFYGGGGNPMRSKVEGFEADYEVLQRLGTPDSEGRRVRVDLVGPWDQGGWGTPFIRKGLNLIEVPKGRAPGGQ
jgi:hypothetical protein